MNTRTLGKTGIEVSEVALGGLFTSSLGPGYEQSKHAVQRALELGVNFIDTAPGYADSEKVLGQILADLGVDPNAGADAPLILSTKLGGRPRDFDPRNKDHLVRSVEQSLKLLKRDVIDILFIHEPDRPGQYDWWSDPQQVYGPVIDVLDELKETGVVRFTGLGGTTATELAHIIRSGLFDVVLTAFNYNALYREALHEIIPAAKQFNMGIVVGSVLGQGALGRRYDEMVHAKPAWLAKPRQQQLIALYDLLDDLGMSIVELGLRFAISNHDVHTVLIGAKTAEQVQQSIDVAGKGPLPLDVIARLDEIAAMVPFRPFEEPMILPFRSAYFGPGPANLGG